MHSKECDDALAGGVLDALMPYFGNVAAYLKYISDFNALAEIDGELPREARLFWAACMDSWAQLIQRRVRALYL